MQLEVLIFHLYTLFYLSQFAMLRDNSRIFIRFLFYNPWRSLYAIF